MTIDEIVKIQVATMRLAAETAEKIGDTVGRTSPSTGELSDDDSNIAEGCYQVAQRLRLDSEFMQSNRFYYFAMCEECGCFMADGKPPTTQPRFAGLCSSCAG